MLILTWLAIVLTIHWDGGVAGAALGVRHTNVLGGLEQHASFSFVRPGLTQTAFAFNGPSSHQSFSSSVGDPHLAHKVQPGVAQALAYRNPGLDLAPVHHGPVAPTYTFGSAAPAAVYASPPLDYQQQQALALAYQHQLPHYHHHHQQQQQQQHQQQHHHPGLSEYGQPLHAPGDDSRVLAANYPLTHASLPADPIPEQIQLQQQRQLQQQLQQHKQNLLGIAYSSSPSVAHVKFNGNGYKLDF